jgi:23S rRNA pseudouridine1911/1915/1917 synthase
MGHPLLGDEVYGKASDFVSGGQVLHAKTLGFIHPFSKQYLFFETELPGYFIEALDFLHKTFFLKGY